MELWFAVTYGSIPSKLAGLCTRTTATIAAIGFRTRAKSEPVFQHLCSHANVACDATCCGKDSHGEYLFPYHGVTLQLHQQWNVG